MFCGYQPNVFLHLFIFFFISFWSMKDREWILFEIFFSICRLARYHELNGVRFVVLNIVINESFDFYLRSILFLFFVFGVLFKMKKKKNKKLRSGLFLAYIPSNLFATRFRCVDVDCPTINKTNAFRSVLWLNIHRRKLVFVKKKIFLAHVLNDIWFVCWMWIVFVNKWNWITI